MIEISALAPTEGIEFAPVSENVEIIQNVR